jgi:uncharacterized protein YbjQ (UPF0145 family)
VSTPLAADAGVIVIVLLYVAPPLLLLMLGFIVGGAVERRHFASIRRRERALSGLVVTDLKTFPNCGPNGPSPMLGSGEVVIATDYLKTFLAGLRNIFGGEMRSYQLLAERAHREALLRMLEAAHRAGFNAVCNVRVETADLNSGGASRTAMLEVFAYGTAYRTATPPATP